jgi:hypothetical protein
MNLSEYYASTREYACAQQLLHAATAMLKRAEVCPSPLFMLAVTAIDTHSASVPFESVHKRLQASRCARIHIRFTAQVWAL